MSRTIRIVRRGGLAAAALALTLAPMLAPSSLHADSANGFWVPFVAQPPVNTASARQSATMVYDSGHDRLVLVGGSPGSSNDVWTLDLTRSSSWVQLTFASTAPKPIPRAHHMSVYDAANDRIIVFGGIASTSRGAEYENDVWQLTLSGTPTWTLLSPLGPLPARREAGAVVYDPVGQQMILFGGYSSSMGYANDVWALSLSGAPQWTQLSPTGISPSARDLASFAYDPDHGSMILFGGWDGTNYLNDAWELTLGEPGWVPISASGAPAGRSEGVGIYDPAAQRFLVYGGVSPSYLHDVWQLSLAGPALWTQLAPSGAGPQGSEGTAACFDPVRRRFAVFGGYDGVVVRADLHYLSLDAPNTWTYPFAAAGSIITPRRDHTSVMVTGSQQMFTFGGTGPTGDNSELWALETSSPNNPWVQVSPGGDVFPQPIHGHRAVWDPIIPSCMAVMGGFNGIYANTLWMFMPSLSNVWGGVAPEPGPSPTGRANFGFGLNAATQQLVVVGGSAGPSTYLNDVWLFSQVSNVVWIPVTPTGTPPAPREIYSMQFDPVGERMIFFGGQNATGLLNDVWALNLTNTGYPSWSQLFPSGTPPSARFGHSMIYDSHDHRMVIFGGYDGSYLNDVWALQLGASPAWSQLAPFGDSPPARDLASAVFVPLGNQMVMMGGWTGTSFLADTWALSFNNVTAVPVVPPSAGFALEGARPNPASGDRLSIAFSLPRAERARLDVLDLAGRKVASRDVSAGAGRQVIAVTPQRALNPGVYVVRLTAGEGSRSAKVAVVR